MFGTRAQNLGWRIFDVSVEEFATKSRSYRTVGWWRRTQLGRSTVKHPGCVAMVQTIPKKNRSPQWSGRSMGKNEHFFNWNFEMDFGRIEIERPFCLGDTMHTLTQPFYRQNLEFWQDWFSRGVSEPLGFTSKLGLLLLSGILNLPGNCELFGMRGLRDHCPVQLGMRKGKNKMPQTFQYPVRFGGLGVKC